MSVQPSLRHFTVAEFDRMIDVGIFDDDDRLELIEGEILEMSPMGERHAACVRKANHSLTRLLGDATLVSVQSPVKANDLSRPEPDVVLLVPRKNFYADGHPQPKHVQVAIEIADSSLGYDREIKVPLYARSGIKEVWLIDVNAGAVTVYSRPRRGEYGLVRSYERGDSIVSARLGGVSVPVSDLVL